MLCTAIDPATHAVGLGGFGVHVVDGPPVVTVPGPITAEAQSALGALVSFDASATDVVSGALPVDCVPASPALFSLDETTTVTCQATDGAGNTTSASFPVTVRRHDAAHALPAARPARPRRGPRRRRGDLRRPAPPISSTAPTP